jgi:hypothetical protein
MNLVVGTRPLYLLRSSRQYSHANMSATRYLLDGRKFAVTTECIFFLLQTKGETSGSILNLEAFLN